MKYALVDNNIIKVGPRDYHYSFFVDYLKQNNLPINDVPWTYDGRNPVQITPSVFIVPVQDPDIPTYNPVTEQLAGPYWNINNTLITGTYDVANTTIDSAQNTMKAIVANARYNKENSKTKVTIQNTEVTVDCVRGYDRDIWFQSAFLLPQGVTQQYKFPYENIWLNLTNDDIQIIVAAIKNVVQTAFDWEKVYVDRIEAATTKSELETIYSELMAEINPVQPILQPIK